MDKKPALVIFSHKITTGIYSFYRNLLQSGAGGQFDITVIFHDNDTWSDSKAPVLYGLSREIVYEYRESQHPTAYEISAAISKLLPDTKGALVTNFITEMIALHICPTPKMTIYFICHDENHYTVARNFNFMIDVFISHNPVFTNRYASEFPERAGAVFYLPYGISHSGYRRLPNPNQPLRVVWLARLMPHKGIHHIPIIDLMLREKGVIVKWTIIGDGPEKLTFSQAVSSRDNFSFHTPPDYESVCKLLVQQDIFILPSSLDGLPVSMIEAMSTGCVPVISEFNAGIGEIITKDIGFVLPVNDNGAFVEAITLLHQDRLLLEHMSEQAYEKAHADYDLEKQSAKYFELFARYNEFHRTKTYPRPAYKGRFLGKLIPAGIRSRILQLVRK